MAIVINEKKCKDPAVSNFRNLNQKVGVLSAANVSEVDLSTLALPPKWFKSGTSQAAASLSVVVWP